MSDERFLSRRNVIQAAWTVTLTFLAFVGGTLYSRWTGPPRVVVTTAPDAPVARNQVKQTETLVDLANRL